jgi:hypothetical protein
MPNTLQCFLLRKCSIWNLTSAISLARIQTSPKYQLDRQRSPTCVSATNHSKAMGKSMKIKRLSEGRREQNSLSSIAQDIIKYGSRVKSPDMRIARDRENSSPWASSRTAMCEAMDTTLATCRNNGLSEQEALQKLHTEAKNMLDSIGEILSRDRTAIIYNRAIRKRETLLSIAGIVCLVFPILVMFDVLTQFLPSEFRSVLAVGAQDESSFGALSRYEALKLPVRSWKCRQVRNCPSSAW